MHNPLDLTRYTTDQIAELRGQVRMNVAALERKGAMLTVSETHTLTQQRALMRRLTRELKSRIRQLPLF